MFERRLYYHLDWAMLAAVITLCGVGVAMIYSATYDPRTGLVGPQFRTQLYAIALGLVALLVCLTIDYRLLANSSLLMFGGLVALLVYVLVAGVVMGGARRWIALGLFNLQPSEFARLVMALVLAMIFGEDRRGARTTQDLLIGLVFLAVPCALIAKQPDLGTAITLLPVYLGITYVAGMRMRLIAVTVVILVLATPIAWKYVLQDYQRTRISTFLDPSKDPRGAGYQQIQARITVGSGGVRGKGFLQGTQGQYNFLPVAHNDFIFSVLAEEQGFIGVLFVLGLYLFVLRRALDAARLAKDRVGAYLVVGLVSGFSFQVIYNITMSAGLAPVKGLTLPLMSYGGSSMIATLASFGLILNVRMRRFTN
jgi:rod shape determining protein RodA